MLQNHFLGSLLTVLLSSVALADAPPPPREAPSRDRPPRGERRPDPRFRPPPFRMPPGGPASVAATDKYVYVVQGGTLYQFDARTLKLIKKVNLPGERRPGFRPRRDERPPPPPRRGEREGKRDEGRDPRRPPRAPAPPAPPPPGGGGGGAFRGRPGGGPASVAANDRYAYVVQGSTLYQFAASGLRVVKQVRLPGMRGPGRPFPGGTPRGEKPPVRPRRPERPKR